MAISIQNEHLVLTFSAIGAELQSVKGTDSLTEYLWSGDAKVWGKFSPVLFPIIGALKNNIYLFEGQTYTLPRHGFARDMHFEYEQISSNEISFTLEANEETLKNYPFNFKLCIKYQLVKAALYCTYQVINRDKKELFFSIGGHPAFAAPLNNEGNYTDYYLQFNKDEEITYHHIVDNLIADETTTVKLTEGKLFLKHELFNHDALVFKNLKSDCISLKNIINYSGLEFQFKDFPYFGIWAAKNANFVCLEPWCGIADGVHHHQQLTIKEGIINLPIHAKFERTWGVTFF